MVPILPLAHKTVACKLLRACDIARRWNGYGMQVVCDYGDKWGKGIVRFDGTKGEEREEGRDRDRD